MFQANGTAFCNGQKQLNESQAILKTAKSSSSQLISNFPPEFEYVSEIISINSDLETINASLNQLIRQADNLKQNLCSIDVTFAKDYYETASKGFFSDDTSWKPSDIYIEANSEKYRETLLKYIYYARNNGIISQDDFNRLYKEYETLTKNKEVSVEDYGIFTDLVTKAKYIGNSVKSISNDFIDFSTNNGIDFVLYFTPVGSVVDGISRIQEYFGVDKNNTLMKKTKGFLNGLKDNIEETFGFDNGKTENLEKSKYFQSLKFTNNLNESDYKYIKNNFNGFLYNDYSYLKYGGNQSTPLNEYLAGDNYYEKIVRYYYPEMSDAEVYDYLYAMQQTGCGYVATSNYIMEAYKDKPQQFEIDFGFPIAQLKDNEISSNINYLFCDVYCYSYKNNIAGVTKQEQVNEMLGYNPLSYIENKIVNLTNNMKNNNSSLASSNYSGSSSNSSGSTVDLWEKIVNSDKYDCCNVEFNNVKEWYGKKDSNTNYYNVVNDALSSRKRVEISATDYTLYYVDENNHKYENVSPIEMKNAPHAMTITGVNDKGEYLISTWGEKYVLDVNSLDENYELNIIENPGAQ